MRLKDFFTVPTGQKVTDKHLRRVLISSICSILLCMTCLVSTTWAWFTVSIVNTGNVIEIATVTANVTIKKTGENTEDAALQVPADGSCTVAAGEYVVTIDLDNAAAAHDDLNRPQGPVYVLMSITSDGGDPAYYYFSFASGQTAAQQKLTVGSDLTKISFSVSWIKPGSATPIGGDTLTIGEIPTEPTEAATVSEETNPPATTEPTTVPEETAPPATTEPIAVPEETDPPATTDPATVPEETSPPVTAAYSGVFLSYSNTP